MLAKYVLDHITNVIIAAKLIKCYPSNYYMYFLVVISLTWGIPPNLQELCHYISQCLRVIHTPLSAVDLLLSRVEMISFTFSKAFEWIDKILNYLVINISKSFQV